MSNINGSNPELFPRDCCILAVLFFPNINNRLKIFANYLRARKMEFLWVGGSVFPIYPKFVKINTEGALCQILITYKVTDVKTLQ